MKSSNTSVAAKFASGAIPLSEATKALLPVTGVEFYMSTGAANSDLINAIDDVLIKAGVIKRDGLTMRNKAGAIVSRALRTKFTLEVMEYNFPRSI